MPGKRKKEVKGHFVSCGPDWVHSLDGHDKFMGCSKQYTAALTLQVERFYE